MKTGAQRGPDCPSANDKGNDKSSNLKPTQKCASFFYPIVASLKAMDLLAFWLWESNSDPLSLTVFICTMGIKVTLHRGIKLVLESYVFSRKLFYLFPNALDSIIHNILLWILKSLLFLYALFSHSKYCLCLLSLLNQYCQSFLH